MSLRLKTILGVALIEAVLLALLVFTVMRYMHDNLEEALIKRANTTAALFSTMAKDPVLSYDLASLEAFSRDLQGNDDIVYVRTLMPDGLVLASAGAPVEPDGRFVADVGLASVDDGVFDVSARIAEGGEVYGMVQIGFDIDRIEDSLSEARQLSTFIAMVEMVLVAIFSLFLGTYLTRQLAVLRKAARSVAVGDLSQRLPVSSKDEVADVALAFNQMSDVLSESRQARDRYEQELVELNRTLEQRVERRTAKLEAQYEELQATHRELAATQARLVQAEKLASVGQLSAGIAHEINNPIAFVNSNTHTLSQYIGIYQRLLGMYRKALVADDDEQASLREAITACEAEEDMSFVEEDIRCLIRDSIEGTTRVQTIVKGLEDFSSERADDKTPCNLSDCIESTLNIARTDLGTCCRLEHEQTSTPAVLANRGQLNQMIMNLVMNAVQAIESSSGHVGESSQCGGTECRRVTVSTGTRGPWVTLTVSDDGPGIAAEHLDRLFDPFFTTKPVGEGTGLGLSIVYGIVQDHDGTITVRSEPGCGATFEVSLPMVESEVLPRVA